MMGETRLMNNIEVVEKTGKRGKLNHLKLVQKGVKTLHYILYMNIILCEI